MSKNFVELGAEADERARTLFKEIPDFAKALGQSRMAAYRDGALDAATKELMALVIGIVMRCEGCITHHAKLCVKRGVTREQLAEAIAVCIQMGGGPAMAYGGEALAAYDQFAADWEKKQAAR
ncbi:MAG TPA: carboxymuconolactone decarboxylase family protein [Alphaproteobacteria bacterium]|jgi:AhpD family alkylhydroperoxidase|nr:carboxymuconolactone decarboxylase family protein [Alphaproteobacteria bacterium]